MSDLYISRLGNWLMSSPPAEWALNQLRELLIGALRQGPIPLHVAFEMDGNRRYAKQHKIEAIEGHHLGFEALAKVLEICYKCGVKVVTVYAFSIENYNRPQYEVDGIMEMAKVKLLQLIQHGTVLARYGVSVRIQGQRDLIRPDVLEVVERTVEETKNNSRAILNICFPYTSREEISQSIRCIVGEYSTPPGPRNTPFSQTRIKQTILSKKLDRPEHLSTIRETSPSPSPSVSRSDEAEGSVSSSTTLPPDSPSRHNSTGDVTILPNPEAITADTLDSHMYISGNPPLDIFVRTSGVERLSDFMLWQCHQDTNVFFLKCFWPEFDLYQFLPVLIEWQWRQKQKARNEKPQKPTKQW